MKRIIAFGFLICFGLGGLPGQDVDDLLNETLTPGSEEVIATFKSTHIITGHSIERMKGGQLDFRIAHRFGTLQSGAYNLWGLDQANIHLGLDYGLTHWLMIGLGRGTYEKTFDGLLKISLLRQHKGSLKKPVNISWLSTASYNSLKWEQPGELPTSDRFSYVHQLLVARKFNDRLSLELNPTLVHRNLVATKLDPNDTWALGAGGRCKLTRRISVNLEYYYVLPPLPDYRSVRVVNPLSIGFDIETGGHVFQLFLSNSLAMIEKGFITETTDKWMDGGIHFGFNISRVFTLN